VSAWQRLEHLDEFFAPVAAAAAELEQLFHLRHDGAALRRACDDNGPATAHLQQALVAEHPQRPQHGVGVHAHNRSQVLCLGNPLAWPGRTVGDRAPAAIARRISAATCLRIGDNVAQARRIYSSAVLVLFSQGGSWRVTTSTGMLDGYLTAVPDRPTPPVPRVADVSAGSVGCPAASP
jgi:hypothetical protein